MTFQFVTYYKFPHLYTTNPSTVEAQILIWFLLPWESYMMQDIDFNRHRKRSEKHQLRHHLRDFPYWGGVENTEKATIEYIHIYNEYIIYYIWLHDVIDKLLLPGNFSFEILDLPISVRGWEDFFLPDLGECERHQTTSLMFFSNAL